jgi:hypothetical protein
MLSFKQLMERVNETRSFYLEEEVEELDESNENFDSNSKAHQAAKKAVKGWRGVSKATYHSDGSATINTKDKTKNRYGKGGHYSGLETTKSHSAVDQHLKNAGGMHNHSRDEYDNHKQKIDGLHWKVKGKATSYGDTHEIHIHEEVDLDESRMKDLAMDMESLSHADFKKKHKRTKQEMQSSLKSEGISLDELSKATMGSYIKKAIPDAEHKEYWGRADRPTKGQRQYLKSAKNRRRGINKAIDKLTKEDAEQTDEALKGSQHKIDANKNGKVDGHDFKILRNAKKARYQ